MAKFQYEVPDDQLQEIAAAFCQQYGYQAKLTETQVSEVVAEDGTKSQQAMEVTIDNPVTPLAFVVEKVQGFMADIVRAYRRNQDELAVLKAAEGRKDVSVNITVL